MYCENNPIDRVDPFGRNRFTDKIRELFHAQYQAEMAKLVHNATIVDVMQLTGSIVIEFATIEEAINSIEILNANENINYAEPVYNMRLTSN